MIEPILIVVCVALAAVLVRWGWPRHVPAARHDWNVTDRGTATYFRPSRELYWIELDPPTWIWPDPAPGYVREYVNEAAALYQGDGSGAGNP
jgi:hypothetical protein